MSGTRWPQLKWCATHDCPAQLWSDGSKGCWYDLVVETTSPDHELEPTAAERALAAWVEWWDSEPWLGTDSGEYIDPPDVLDESRRLVGLGGDDNNR